MPLGRKRPQILSDPNPILDAAQNELLTWVSTFASYPFCCCWAISFQAAPRTTRKVSSQPARIACSPFHTSAHPDNKSTCADRGTRARAIFSSWRRLQMVSQHSGASHPRENIPCCSEKKASHPPTAPPIQGSGPEYFSSQNHFALLMQQQGQAGGENRQQNPKTLSSSFTGCMSDYKSFHALTSKFLSPWPWLHSCLERKRFNLPAPSQPHPILFPTKWTCNARPQSKYLRFRTSPIVMYLIPNCWVNCACFSRLSLVL